MGVFKSLNRLRCLLNLGIRKIFDGLQAHEATQLTPASQDGNRTSLIYYMPSCAGSRSKVTTLHLEQLSSLGFRHPAEVKKNGIIDWEKFEDKLEETRMYVKTMSIHRTSDAADKFEKNN